MTNSSFILRSLFVSIPFYQYYILKNGVGNKLGRDKLKSHRGLGREILMPVVEIGSREIKKCWAAVVKYNQFSTPIFDHFLDPLFGIVFGAYKSSFSTPQNRSFLSSNWVAINWPHFWSFYGVGVAGVQNR
jgi:hypothetical protein